MKYCIDCTIDTEHNALVIAGVWSLDNIQFISDETQKKLICSPFTKTTNVAVTAGTTNTTITILPVTDCTLESGDLITLVIDDFKSTQDILNAISTGNGNVNANIGEKPVGGYTIRELLNAISTNALTDSDLTALQNVITALIGAATDTSTASTLFGKLAAVLSNLSTTDGKVDTANTNISAIISNLGAKGVSDLTIRELLAAIKSDALTITQLNTAKEAITNLIGAASDGTTASTVFGKLAAILADTATLKSDTSTLKIDTSNLEGNIGAKGVSDLTVRQLLNAIQTNALTVTQLNDAKTAITNLIGAASDSSSALTIFGKIAAAKAIIDKLDSNLGVDANNDAHTKLNEILRVIDLFAYGYAITANNDGTDTYTLDLDNSAAIDDTILTIA